MDQLTRQGQVLIILFLVGAKNVDGKRGGEGCQCRARSRVGRCHQSDDKEDADEEGETVTPGHLAKEGVSFDADYLRHKAVSIHVE